LLSHKIPLVHLILIVAAWTSPWWLDWRLITGASVAIGAQYLLFGGCILTNMETGGKPYDTFYYHYLARVWPAAPKKVIWYFMRFIAPVLLPLLGFVLQVVFHRSVWLMLP
jgi:hypothetical protein